MITLNFVVKLHVLIMSKHENIKKFLRQDTDPWGSLGTKYSDSVWLKY